MYWLFCMYTMQTQRHNNFILFSLNGKIEWKISFCIHHSDFPKIFIVRFSHLTLNCQYKIAIRKFDIIFFEWECLKLVLFCFFVHSNYFPANDRVHYIYFFLNQTIENKGKLKFRLKKLIIYSH